jgi:hypothetical protein
MGSVELYRFSNNRSGFSAPPLVGTPNAPTEIETLHTTVGVQPAAINNFLTFRCVDHHPIRIRDERERLLTASPVMTKGRALLVAGGK